MLQFHENWHCTNRDGVGPDWGRRFFGFHKQFLFGYDNYLASMGQPFVKTWVAATGAIIPPAHGGRPPGQPCSTCVNLPPNFKLPPDGTLNTYATVKDIGNAIVGWHNTNHVRIAAAGGTGGCVGARDMACPATAPNDPIFYRYHHIFDDIQDSWRSLLPTDIAIVLDRSGSMSLPAQTGGNRLDAAKSAAGLFVDLFEMGSAHKIGMVSFSTSASATPDMPLTDVPSAPAALSAALAGIVPSGTTSIGDGLEKGQALIAGGSEPRKAIVLLTDGQENTPPTILNSQPGLLDTHVCSIGLGTPGSLDGPKLQDLSERQGGIYLSTVSPLMLKKFFVFCFSNIFGPAASVDPIETLLANELVSSPTIHSSLSDEKLVFILGWTNSSEKLQLAITAPSGSILNLNAPTVESKIGPTWHIVHIKLPFNAERDGSWTARAIRPVHGYVNGFSSRSFGNFEKGAILVRNELINLCANGCHNILYYEDKANHTSFEDHNSIYAEALFGQSGQRSLGNIVSPANASEFTQALQNGFGERGFDLLIYSSQFTETEQPYDSLLARLLCSRRFRSIVSDNRHTTGAREILRCAGAVRGKLTNFTTIAPTISLLLDSPTHLRPSPNVLDFSYSLLPYLVNSTATQATNNGSAIAVLAVGSQGSNETFFITVLTQSTTKLKPFKHINNTYTLEPLHPTFHIPEQHWPTCGYDNVTAFVNVTRPLTSLSRLLSSVGSTTGSTIAGDTLSPREVAAQRLEQQGIVIPTETKQFQLYDDGTHGDETPGDRYWEISLPKEFTAIDGDYNMHAFFRFCRGRNSKCGGETCVEREAQQSLTIRASMDSSKTKVVMQKIPCHGYGCGRQKKARIFVTPRDRSGTLMGPGLVNELVISVVGRVVIESRGDADGKGRYEIVINWEERKGERAVVIIAQYGRPKGAIRVDL
ncbi:MAG: hypothetical protein M1839_000807 [Geoglossum umbratile]|nr:MAG: hypothetical protein M1839_000807 [Geoglossum umbratile]